MNTPLVSIGILSYNRPDDLVRAIESAINQTYHNLEIIISDNGSDDQRCAEIIWEYAKQDGRIKPYVHEINRGPQFNFKFLTEVASGKYFSWLADDDALTNSQILDCVEILENESKVIIAACSPLILESRMPIKFNYVPHTFGLSEPKRHIILIRSLFMDINLFYYGLIRLKELRLCNLHFKKLFGSDLLLLLELLEYGDIFINTNKPGYLYNIHEGQTSTKPTRYRDITLKSGATFEETAFFFSAYIYRMVEIILSSTKLSIRNKHLSIIEIFSQYYRTNRFHLIKYDLRINKLLQAFKRLFFKK
ncbi:MAG: glycosyltransferase family 2 protein [Bacteroidetes bacterium]|nr:glycosyltransferase family 2 protein [Bacteroidota bacterium]MBS1744776.1 glycosyltransferase family 2 protein [Bacteroidota bacterium]